MKIAVVGSGVSGLTSGHLLASQHEVHLFEAITRLGGHTDTHEIEVASGKYNVDTGFIVHNDRNYPNFIKLMKKFNIETQPSEMSFSVKVERTGLEYNGNTINSLFCQRRNLVNPSFYLMLYDIMRFNSQATKYYLENPDKEDGTTLEEYLRLHKYGEEFTECYILPMVAAIWSASRDEIRKFPLSFFVRFFHNHGLFTLNDRPQWRVLKGGSKTYIPHFISNFKDNIHLNTPVLEVKRNEKTVSVTTAKGTSEFDHVIFASHANQTMKMLVDATPLEKEVMAGFDYRPNDVILHTDTSILPRTELGHASWNYYLPKNERERLALTYHMNILQGIKSPEKFLVSLNMDDMIDPKKIIKKISYHHPVYTLSAIKSQKRWDSISGKDRIHFCGAYWGNGFHEDGVKSGVAVAAHFGITL